MSTQEISNPVMYARQPRRRKMLEVDLNVPPSTVNMVQGQQKGTSTHTASQDGTNVQQDGSIPPLIDVEAFDDDVMISSPREFAEAKAKNNSRRNRGRTDIIDIDSEGQSTRFSPYNLIKHGRVPSNQNRNRELFMTVEGSSKHVNENVWSMTMPPPLPPPPKNPTLTCPICMGPFVEEMSTKCGHIFCKKCIRASLAVRRTCPTCRGKISMKNTIRVYIPTNN